MNTHCTDHILIIDDEAEIVACQKEHLESLGFKVTGHTDSVAALNQFLLDPERYRLVITDYCMPELNGLELAGLLSNARPDLPIIMITGSMNFSRETARKAGILAAFPKPMNIHRLGEIVNQTILAKKSRHERRFDRDWQRRRAARYC